MLIKKKKIQATWQQILDPCYSLLYLCLEYSPIHKRHSITTCCKPNKAFFLLVSSILKDEKDNLQWQPFNVSSHPFPIWSSLPATISITCISISFWPNTEYEKGKRPSTLISSPQWSLLTMVYQAHPWQLFQSNVINVTITLKSLKFQQVRGTAQACIF